MASETTTPNIGLQIPAYNQANWQVPTNYNWNLLDLIFGGEIQVPALSVINLTVANIGSLLAAGFVVEQPVGAVPGSVYTCTFAPTIMFGVFISGQFQRPHGLDYALAGNVITFNAPTFSGATVYAVYLR